MITNISMDNTELKHKPSFSIQNDTCRSTNRVSNSNHLGVNSFVRNIQVFSLCRLNKIRFPTLRLYLMFGLYLIPVYSRFGLDRFPCALCRENHIHCITIVSCRALLNIYENIKTMSITLFKGTYASTNGIYILQR